MVVVVTVKHAAKAVHLAVAAVVAVAAAVVHLQGQHGQTVVSLQEALVECHHSSFSHLI